MKSLIENGYFFEFDSNESAAHVFCGPNDTKGTVCPNCHQPLLRFCLIDLTDAAFINFAFASKLLPLVYCWKCNIAQDLFFYECKNDEVKLVYFRSGGVQVDFPYANYPSQFPLKRFSLSRISEEDQLLLRRINEREVNELDLSKTRRELTEPRNQIGGQPYLVQKNTDDELHCYNCKEPMLLLASIADDAERGYSFVDNAYVQVLYFYCLRCHLIGATQQCD